MTQQQQHETWYKPAASIFTHLISQSVVLGLFFLSTETSWFKIELYLHKMQCRATIKSHYFTKKATTITITGITILDYWNITIEHTRCEK